MPEALGRKWCEMMRVHSAAVVGLGLVGGSVARELASRGVEVVGHDTEPEHLREALRQGAIERALGPGWEEVREVDLLVIAVPVSAAPAVLARAAPLLRRARLIIDVGSTKQTIVTTAEGLGLAERFVGTHPLAGDHRAGWSASRLGLFEGACTYLCPAPSTHPEALRLAEELWSELGGRPEIADAAEHDRRLAWTSHLPQILASTLAHSLARAGVTRAELGPGGRDMTRLAASSPDLWTAVLEDNAAHIRPAVQAIREQLRVLGDALGDALEDPDSEALQAFLRAAREWSAAGVAAPRETPAGRR